MKICMGGALPATAGRRPPCRWAAAVAIRSVLLLGSDLDVLLLLVDEEQVAGLRLEVPVLLERDRDALGALARRDVGLADRREHQRARRGLARLADGRDRVHHHRRGLPGWHAERAVRTVLRDARDDRLVERARVPLDLGAEV